MPRVDIGARRARYEASRLRYAKRAARQRRTYPYLAYPDRPLISYVNHAKGPWIFKGDGSSQAPLASIVKNAAAGPILPFTPGDYEITPAHYQQPPHVVLLADPTPALPSHPTFARVNYHHRAQMYRGHKIGRFNGAQRRSWMAWKVAAAWHREQGEWAFPSWDPDGRTPVIPGS